MTMTPEQVDALVQRLEKYARQEPANYRLRVGLLAALGYAYVFLVFIVLVGVVLTFRQLILSSQSGGELVSQLNLVTAVLLFSLLRLFWVNYQPPKGVELKREQLPQLFALVDELTAALEAPKFHHIILDEQLNAGVLQVPRLGFLGWQRNYLILGLPLMQALSPEQFKAVLAHELGHLSGNHSRFSGWIYRVRNTWFQLVERFQTDGQKGSLLFERFFNWYAPFFKAYSFVLARANEYEADRCAAQLGGTHHAAEALINLELRGSFLQKSFWPKVYKQALQTIEPPDDIVVTLSQQLRTPIATEKASIWLDQALAKKTNNENTHPCLADRLSAFGYLPTGYQPPLPAPVQETAAEHFLGDQLESFTTGLEKIWQQEIASTWKHLHISAQQRSRQLKALEAKSENGALTSAEMWKLAQLTAEFKDDAAAKPFFQAVFNQEPLHPGANYQLGELLLEEKDPAGIRHIETAMAQDFNLITPGCQLLYKFFKQQGHPKKAEAYQEKAQAHDSKWQQAREERNIVGYRDALTPHNLLDTEVQQIATQLSDFAWVREAFLVKKTVKYFPEQPLYVLGVTRRYVRDEEKSYKQEHELVAQLSQELIFPHEVNVIILSEYRLKLKQAISRIKGALIYRS